MAGFDFRRTAMEAESPEEVGYDSIRANLGESSLSDRRFADLGIDLDHLVLLYGDHRGDPRLRELVAARSGVRPDDVLATAGGALALFLVATALGGPGTRTLVTAPNYVANVETPRALGGAVDLLELTYDDRWGVDPEAVRRSLTPHTRLVSVTSPHNPTGTEIDRATLDRLLAIVEATADSYLLVDQTYAELSGPDPLPDVASLSPRAISVSGVSKTYGVPGIRQGWITCADPDLMTTLLAVKEQVVLTGSVLDEAIAAAVLDRREALLPAIRAAVAARGAIVADWIDRHPALEWVTPTGGVTGFPRIRADHPAAPDWHRTLLAEHAVFVGPGHWFDQPWRHFRLGWGWPDEAELRAGLAGIDSVLGAGPTPAEPTRTEPTRPAPTA